MRRYLKKVFGRSCLGNCLDFKNGDQSCWSPFFVFIITYCLLCKVFLAKMLSSSEVIPIPKDIPPIKLRLLIKGSTAPKIRKIIPIIISLLLVKLIFVLAPNFVCSTVICINAIMFNKIKISRINLTSLDSWITFRI